MKSSKRKRDKPQHDQAAEPLRDGLFYTCEETARFLRTSAVTLAIWRCKGLYPDLRPIEIGRKRLYAGTTIRQFIEGHTREKVA